MLPQCIFFIFQPEGVLMLFSSRVTIAPCLSIIETQLSSPFARFTLDFVANSILLTFARFRAAAGEAIISSTAWGLQRLSFGEVLCFSNSRFAISGCACANNTSKSLISASFGQRPEARGQRPEAREGTKDYKRSCKERINQIFPHHHTVFLMKM